VRVWRSLISVHGLRSAISRFEWILSFPSIRINDDAFGVPHCILGG
jgi:hypothetical protein